MTNILTSIIVVIAVSITMKKMLMGSQQAPKVDVQGKKVLRYPKFYQVLGWIVSIIIIVISVGALSESQSVNGTWIMLIFSLLFLWMGVYLILSKNCVLTFDSEKIEYQDSFCRKKTMFWKDIKKVVVKRSKNLYLYDNKQKIHINYSIVGFQSLIDALKEKVDPLIIGDAQEKINKYYEYINNR